MSVDNICNSILLSDGPDRSRAAELARECAKQALNDFRCGECPHQRTCERQQGCWCELSMRAYVKEQEQAERKEAEQEYAREKKMQDMHENHMSHLWGLWNSL